MTFVWIVVLTEHSVILLSNRSMEMSTSYPLGCVCFMSFTCGSPVVLMAVYRECQFTVSRAFCRWYHNKSMLLTDIEKKTHQPKSWDVLSLIMRVRGCTGRKTKEVNKTFGGDNRETITYSFIFIGVCAVSAVMDSTKMVSLKHAMHCDCVHSFPVRLYFHLVSFPKISLLLLSSHLQIKYFLYLYNP